MLIITKYLSIPLAEIKCSFIASPGPGGQNVNKVATAVQLRFNVLNSPSLPYAIRERLIAQLKNKLTASGDLIIKASRHRTQTRNKQDALERLAIWIKQAAVIPKKRKKTRPTLASKERRLTSKKLQAGKKALRQHRDE